MANFEIRLIILFATKDGEALYSQQKQDWEVTVAQIMNSYCQIQTEIERFYEDLQDLLELTPKKRYPFHYRELECKSRKSREI